MLPKVSITVLPRTSGSYSKIDGSWVDSASASTVITGSIQPLSDREIKNLPEGRSIADSLLIITQDTLVVGKEDQNGDMVEIGGETYETVADSYYRMIMPHHEYIVSKV